MKYKITYWIETLAPSLLFVATFFLFSFAYFEWHTGVYSVFAIFFFLLVFYIFFHEASEAKTIQLDVDILNDFKNHESFFLLSQESLIVVNKDELLQCNKQFEELTGKNKAQLLGFEWLKLIFEEDLFSLMEWLDFKNNQEDDQLTFRMYNYLSGELVWLKARKRKLETSSDSNEKIHIVSFKDISNYKLYEERAIESQIQVYTLIDFAPLGIIIFDNQGKVEYINKFGQQLVGFSKSDLMPLGMAELLDEDDRSTALVEWDNFLNRKDETFLKKMKLKSKNGDILNVLINGVAVRSLDGKISSYFVTFTDITETQKLINKNQFFVGLLDNSDAISIVSPEGKIVKANDLFLKSIHLEEQKVVGKSYNMIFIGRSGFPSAIYQIEADQVYRDEISIRVQKKKMWFDRTFIPYFVNNKLEHFYIIHKDITRRVEHESQIKNANEILSLVSSSQKDFISSADRSVFNKIIQSIAKVNRSSIAILTDIVEDEAPMVLSIFTDEDSQSNDWKIEFQANQYVNILNVIINFVVDSGEVFLSNDPYHDPRIEGKLASSSKILKNALLIPIKENTKVVGVLAFANSEKEYDWGDVEILNPITLSLGTMVFAAKEMNIRDEVERKNLELQRKITSQLKQLDEILSTSPDSFILLDSKGLIEFTSIKDLSFLNPKVNLNVGTSLYDLDEDLFINKQIFVELFERSLNGSKSFGTIQVEGRQEKTTGIDYFLTFNNVHNNKDEIVSVVCAIKDISEQKIHERELSLARDAAIKASETKSDYLKSIYAELEHPINSIINLVKVFSEQDLSANERFFLSIFKDASNEIEHLMSSLFNLSISTLERNSISYDEFDFIDLLEQVLQKSHTRFIQNKIELSVVNHYPHSTFISANKQHTKDVVNALIEVILESKIEGTVNLVIDEDLIEKPKWNLKINVNSKSIPSELNELLLENNGDKVSLATLFLFKEKLFKNLSFSLKEVDKIENIVIRFNFNRFLSERIDTRLSVKVFEENTSSDGLNAGPKIDTNFNYKTSIIYDHRDDYAMSLSHYLKDLLIESEIKESFSQLVNQSELATYDYIFLDLSNINPEMEVDILRIGLQKKGRLIGIVNVNQASFVEKAHVLGIDKIIYRPFRKSEIIQSVT